MPPAVNQSNVKHYRHARTVTDYKEFGGRSHYSVIGHDGWEEVADHALEWATEHAATRPEYIGYSRTACLEEVFSETDDFQVPRG